MSTVKSNILSPQSLPLVEIEGFNESESFVVGTGQTTFTSQKFTDKTPVRAFIRNDADPQVWDELTVNFTTTTDFEIVEGVSDGDDFIVYGITGYLQTNEDITSDDVLSESTNTLFSGLETLTQILNQFNESALLESFKDYGVGSDQLQSLTDVEAEDDTLVSGLYFLDNQTASTQGFLLNFNDQQTVKQIYYPIGESKIFIRDNDGGAFSSFVEVSGSGGGSGELSEKQVISLGSDYTVSQSDLGSLLISDQISNVVIPDVDTTTIPEGFFCEFIEVNGKISISSEISNQLVSKEGNSIGTTGEGSMVQLRRISSDKWVANGDIVETVILIGAWNLNNASYDSVSLDVNNEEVNPNTIYFKDDGTKVYMSGTGSDSIHQYTLSTPWDLSTATYDSVAFSVGTEDTSPQGIFFKPDGETLYMIGVGSNSIHQYTLSTPWDVSTASYDSVSLDVSTEDTSPREVFFKYDGMKMYVVGFTSNSIHQYTLSTAWDISSATYDSVAFDLSNEDTESQGVFFKPDGTFMYIVGSANDTLYQYSLSTAWDISSATYNGVNLDVGVVGVNETQPRDMFFKPDGDKLYMVGLSDDQIHQYTVSA